MRILVTGCQGTLGAPLVSELLERGHDVFGIDLKHEEEFAYFRRCDITKYRQLQDVYVTLEPDLVFHLGAEFGRKNGEEYYEQVWESNVIGTRNILEIQRNFGGKLIFASSSEIYGDVDVPIITEETPSARLKNDYAITKWVNEQQCMNFRERHGNKIMTLRFFNAYGPGEFFHQYRSVVCLFCYYALRGLPYEVYEGYHRVFMYVGDFIKTLGNAVDNFMDGEIINIGGSEYRSVRELSDMIQEMTGNKSEIEYLPEDTHNVMNKRPDITKAVKFLGHDPKTTLEEGVVKTLEWMREVYSIEEGKGCQCQ